MAMYLVVGCTMGDVYERERKGGVIQDNKSGHSITLLSPRVQDAWILESVRKSTRDWATTSPGSSARPENDISQVKSVRILVFS